MPKQRREVMAAEVMRGALTSAAEHLKLAQAELGVALRVAHEANSSVALLMDREIELQNTQVWLLSALDALQQGAIVGGSGASQRQ
jgi:hypothetical protein